jgi:hypothetical protein
MYTPSIKDSQYKFRQATKYRDPFLVLLLLLTRILFVLAGQLLSFLFFKGSARGFTESFFAYTIFM